MKYELQVKISQLGVKPRFSEVFKGSCERRQPLTMELILTCRQNEPELKPSGEI